MPIYRENKELQDMMDELKRSGLEKFREMFGGEVVDILKAAAKEEKLINGIRDKIKLQSILKRAFPSCEKCKHWSGVGLDSKPCPYSDLAKDIIFQKDEVENDFEIEVCEKFSWKLDKKG